MTRMKLLSPLFATLVLSALCVAARNIAVVITDVKLDDKVAIHALSRSGDFAEIIAILGAVEDQDGANADLLDFLEKMEGDDENHYKHSPAKLTVLKGDNVKGVAASHEKQFPGAKADSNLVYFNAKSFSDLIGESVEKPTVEIFQIAPTHRSQIETLAAMDNIDITLFHLIHGFNSAQGKVAYGGVESMDFLTQIGDVIHMKHPNARIVFTKNDSSFQNKKGGTQEYSELADGAVPADHLDAALKDEFYIRQLTLAFRILDEAKLIIVINQLKRAAKLVAKYGGDANVVPSLGTEQFPLVDLPKNVFRAGMQLAYKNSGMNDANDISLRRMDIVNEYRQEEDTAISFHLRIFGFIDAMISFTMQTLDGEIALSEEEGKRQEEDAAITSHFIGFTDAVLSFMKTLDALSEEEDTLMKNLDTFVREFLTGKDPLISTHVKYFRGETPKNLSDDENWIAQMKTVGTVKKETVSGDYEDVLYNKDKAIVGELDAAKYQADDNEWYEDYKYKEIFDLILSARKTIGDKGREYILAYVDAIKPIVFEYQPMTLEFAGLVGRFKGAIPTAFHPETKLTVEVCDANHVLLVRDAVKTAEDKFLDVGFKYEEEGQKGNILFDFDFKDGESYGKTLKGLKTTDALELLKPYLLRKRPGVFRFSRR